MTDRLFARIRARAERSESRVALTFGAPGDPGRTSLTYAELVDRSAALARAIAARAESGARVLLLLPAVPEFALAFLGCLQAGVVAVPVPPPVDESTLRRVVNVARDCDASLVVSTTQVRALAEAGALQLRQLAQRYPWLTADDYEPITGGRRLASPTADQIAFLQYTSGSTGSPRGVMVTHGNLLANEEAITEAFGVRPDSTIVSWLPLHHDMGLIGGLLQPLYCGARGVVVDPWSFVVRPASWLELIAHERADISGGPNFAYDLCVRKVPDELAASLDLSCWRVAFNGAAQVYPRTLRAFSEKFRGTGFRAEANVPCYGLAEATLLVAGSAAAPAPVRTFSASALESGHALSAPDGHELVGYRLLGHAAVRVVHPATGVPVADGTSGEIVVSGLSNGVGYWGDPVRSAATFGLTLPGDERRYLRTGDLGFLLNGDLHVQGRRKDLIVHRGRNLHPEDLEADVSRCDPALRPGCCAVFSVAGDADEEIVVCQEVRVGTPDAAYPAIASRIRATLSSGYGATARIVVLTPPGTVPKTSSGKIQRRAAAALFTDGTLAALHTSTAAVAASSSAPGLAARLASARAAAPDALVDALCDHLHATLGLAVRPSGDESLTALGVDSVQALQLGYEIEAALGAAPRPSALLRAPSLRELARAAASAAPALAVAAPDGYELTQSQRSLWFVQQAERDSFACNVTRAFRVTGPVDEDRLAAALRAVLGRHQSLRLNVIAAGGVPSALLRDGTPDVPVLDATGWSADREAAWLRDLATTPFDLEYDRLVRCTLLRRPADHLLLLSLHHIVCDLTSLELLVADLAATYAGGCPPATPAAVSPAEMERTVLRERGEELAAFWRAELSGELPVLSLPAPSPKRGLPAAGSVELRASETLASGLTRFARSAGRTVHAVLLAAFQTLLHRWSGQDDLLVGVPVSNRPKALAGWVGYQVNAVPVRSAHAPDMPFREFAERTHRRVLDVLDHHELPLAEITRLANPDRIDPTASIFQAMFAYYAAPAGPSRLAAAAVMGDPDEELPMSGCGLRGYPIPDVTTQTPLCLNVTARGGVLLTQLQYDPRRVAPAAAEHIARGYLTLLEAAVADPATPVRRLPLLTLADSAALVAAGTGLSALRPPTYLEAFEDFAARSPDAVAAEDEHHTVTYAELDEHANHAAAELRAHGVGIDSAVLVCARRSVHYLVALLAIHKAEGCYVPVTPDQAARAAAAVRPLIAISDASGTAAVASVDRGPVVLDLQRLAAGRSARPPERSSAAAGAAYVLHTSGSTGPPKLVVATNGGMHNHLWQMVERLQLTRSDCVGQTSPITVDLAIWQFLAPLLVGGRVRIAPEAGALSARHLLEHVRHDGVTVLELLPSVIVAMLDAGLSDAPGALRAMIATGDPLTRDLPVRWRDEVPDIALYNAYGATECTDDVSIGLCAWGPRIPATPTIGHPLANTSMFVLGACLQPVPPGAVGTVHAGGAGVTRGYLGDPRRTALAYIPDPWSKQPGARLYRMGDLARASIAGDLEFLGRADDQIKLHGLRVNTLEVEAALRACPGVAEAAVRVHEGPARAFLVGYLAFRTHQRASGAAGDADGWPVLEPDADRRLRALLLRALPRHMVPTVLVAVPRLPRTGTDKIDYRLLAYPGPEPYRDAGAEGFDDPVAAAVRRIWADTLGVPAVGWTDNFFQLGGHSLAAVGMIDRVREVLGADVEIGTVFAEPRLHEFVAAVRAARHPGGDPGGGFPATAPVPASAAQQRFWFLHEVSPGDATYNMPGVLRFQGDLDDGALEAALRLVLARHQVLLARFTIEESELSWTPGDPAAFELPRLDLRGAIAEFGDIVFDSLAGAEAARPANLRREFPFRAVLARVGLRDWRLVVTIDHIACDGWSLEVFLDDLAAAYNGRPGPAPAYTFADYCHDERAYLRGLDRAAVANLWCIDPGERLTTALRRAGDVAPDAHAGPARLAGRHAVAVDPPTAERIRELARVTGTTPFAVFAVGLACLMHHGSGQETVVLGTLAAQRDRPQWRRVVGPLLNVSLLMLRLAPQDAVGAALDSAREAILRIHRGGRMPFQEIASRLPAAPGGNGEPFDVLLVMQPETGEPPTFDGLTTELAESAAGAAPYPLTIDVEATGGGYRIACRYDPDRYAPASIERLAARLADLLDGLCTDARRPLSDFIAPAVTAP